MFGGFRAHGLLPKSLHGSDACSHWPRKPEGQIGPRLFAAAHFGDGAFHLPIVAAHGTQLDMSKASGLVKAALG